MPSSPKPIGPRFASKYSIDPSGCWIWNARTNAKGYGCFSIPSGRRPGHERLAHRVSWELHRGPIPEGHNVCHHCDNPPCVNPDHLFTGTQLDNVRDCDAKGRRRWRGIRGSANVASKLTEVDVAKIRTLYRDKTISQSAMARMFGVCTAQIWRIVHNQRWAHLCL